MILNMHVRHDWQKWLDTEQKYVKALCGANTTTKYAGVPGVTDQPWRLEGEDVVMSGWCYECITGLYNILASLPADLPTSDIVVKQYNVAANACAGILSRPKPQSFSIKPIRGTQESRDRAAEKAAWKLYWRYKPCYLCGRGGMTDGIDHIIPIARGGPDEWWNKAPVHSRCNQIKGDMSPSGLKEVFPNVVLPEVFLANLT